MWPDLKSEQNRDFLQDKSVIKIGKGGGPKKITFLVVFYYY